ncbi:hypothetical protein C0L90_21365 [Xanthomonas oryzae pv. oryzae]|nr:hypothetical protein C0L89_21340 [Xanthomonas oryzae pv. oryzae]AVU04365.1 hypothetical protein C0L90_21365 [Xanthomonas oryzae pv. oryzae]
MAANAARSDPQYGAGSSAAMKLRPRAKHGAANRRLRVVARRVRTACSNRGVQMTWRTEQRPPLPSGCARVSFAAPNAQLQPRDLA